MLMCVLFATNIWGQNAKVDSLKVLLDNYEFKNSEKSYQVKDSVKVNLLIKIGSSYGYQQPGEAMNYVVEALNIAKSIEYKKGIADSKFQIGRIQSENKQTNKSIKTTYEAIELYRQLGDSLKIADCYNNIGVIYATTGNYVWAVSELFKAITIYEKLDEPLIVINGYANIGTINKILGNQDLAKHYYEKSLDMAKGELEFLPDFAGIYLNLGRLNFDLKDFEQSNLCYDKALRCLLKKPDEYLKATIYNSIAENAIAKNNFTKAFKYLYSAKNTFQSIGSDNGLVEVLVNLAECYLKTNQLDQAENYILRSIVIAEEFEMVATRIKAYKSMIDICERRGKYETAYKFQKLYKELSDRQYDLNNQNKMIQMQMQYDFDKVDASKKEKRLLNEISLRENTAKTVLVKYVSSIILLLLLIFSLFILKHLHQNIKQKDTIQQYNDMLNEQNKEIQTSLVQKNILLKEIHHRVKNNLQIISSLLTIESNETKDYEVVDLIEEGLSKIQAMSSIHETLFLFEHLDEINLNDYFGKLLDNLKNIHSFKSDQFIYEIDTQNIFLNINTTIPLGLIINELVTNSIKHAPIDHQGLTVQIILRKVDDISFELVYSDNISLISSQQDLLNSKSFGIKLVKILCDQINGKIDICVKPSLIYKILFSIQ